MNRRLLRFTFEREAGWMLVLYLAIPLLGAALTILLPGLLRAWR